MAAESGSPEASVSRIDSMSRRIGCDGALCRIISSAVIIGIPARTIVANCRINATTCDEEGLAKSPVTFLGFVS